MNVTSEATATIPGFPPSGTGSQTSAPVQSAPALQSRMFGRVHAVVQNVLAVILAASLGAEPLGVAKKGTKVPQQTSPVPQSCGPEHSVCTGFVHAARSVQTPDNPSAQHVCPCGHLPPLNDSQAPAAS